VPTSSAIGATRPRRALLVAVVLCAALLPAVPIAAQNAGSTQTPEAPPEPPKKAIQPIPASEIAVAAEQAKRQFGEIEKTLEPSKEVVAARESLPDLRRRVAAQVEASDETTGAAPDVMSLEELTMTWDALGAEIDAIQALLAKRGKQIEEQGRKVREMTERWRVTREASVAAEVAPEIVQRIDEVLASGKRVLDSANQRQGAIVTLQSQTAELSGTRRAQLDRLAEVRDSLVGNVLQRDRAPLWHPRVYEPLTGGEMWDQLKATEVREYENSRGYILRNQLPILLHLLLLVGLVIGMLAARGRVRLRAQTDEGLGAVKAVFDSPISLSVLLVMLLVVWTFADMPRAMAGILGMALLIPAVLVLRRLLDPGLFALLNLLVALVVLDRLRMVLAPLPHAPRLVFLVQMLAVAGIALWFTRSARLRQLSPEAARARHVRAVDAWMRVALVASLFSAAAEVAGYSSLGLLVGGAVLFAAFAAVVLYGGYRVIDGLVAYALLARPLRLLGMVQRHRRLIREKTMRLVGIAAVLWWGYALLRRLGVFDEVWGALVAVFTTGLPLGEIAITLGDVALFFLTIWITFQLSKFIRFALEEDVYTRVGLRKGQPYAVSTLTHYIILTVGVLLAFAALGLDLNRFTLLAGAFGVGIGFGLQTIVNNFVSGLILLTERPVEVGDTVQLVEGDVFGEVQRIGIRSSTVRTWQGAEVIVPNADLVASQVTNWTHSDKRRRMEVQVGVPYGTDPAWMLQVLLEVPKANPGVLDDPAPSVLFTSFGDSALLFEVRCWTDDFENFLSVKSEVTVGIAEALKRVGVEIPFPQRDLHVKSVPAPSTGERPESQPSERPRLARAGTGGLDDRGGERD
jgi:potassium efflux system protein